MLTRPYPRYGASEPSIDVGAMSPTELQTYADSLGGWSHEIALPGVNTGNNCSKDRAFMEREWATMALPDLRDKTVIDVGGADGGYAFMADLAHALLASRVQAMPLDFMHCDLEQVGRWDVVLFLGLLYHLDDPIGALRRLYAITSEQAIVETEAVAIPGCDEPMWQLYPGPELNHDWTNWWAPNLGGLLAGLGAAGFSNSEVLQGPPENPQHMQNYRLIVRATR